TASLGVGPTHVESAEWVRSDHSARGLAIEVEIAHMKGAARAIHQLVTGRIDRACESVLRVVGYAQTLVKGGHLNDRQHRPEDLLLRQNSVRGDLREDGRLN